MRLKEIINKKIAIWGFGKEGQSICNRILKANPQAQITIFDDKPDIARVKVTETGVTAEVQSSNLISQADVEVVIKSPGISLYREETLALQKKNTPITSVSSLWFSEPRTGRVIAVSGTKGKSTSSSLLAHMIKESGKRVQLAGNIGYALSDCWPSETEVDYWVIELSSYQLADLSAEFDALILTNIYQDHLNWHGSAEQYRIDKLTAIEKVKPGGMVVAPSTIELTRQDITFLPIEESHIGHFSWDNFQIYEREKSIFQISASSPIHGKHNLHNATIAIAMLDKLGIKLNRVLKWIDSYSPLPHRLQLVGEKSGVRFINDSISTTPQSTIAALDAFRSASDTCLIIGGENRGVDLGPLIEYLKDKPHSKIFALPETGKIIIDQVGRGTYFKTLEDAVRCAYESCKAGGVVLMSPGASSFNQFDNYQHRGESFIAYFQAQLEK